MAHVVDCMKPANEQTAAGGANPMLSTREGAKMARRAQRAGKGFAPGPGP